MDTYKLGKLNLAQTLLQTIVQAFQQDAGGQTVRKIFGQTFYSLKLSLQRQPRKGRIIR